MLTTAISTNATAVEGRRQPPVRFGEQLAGIGDVVGVADGVEELVQVAFIGLAPARHLRFRELLEIERVAVEEQKRDLAVFGCPAPGDSL